jgi:hypothetical protein
MQLSGAVMSTRPNLLAEIQTAYAPGADARRAAALASLRKAFLAAALTEDETPDIQTGPAHKRHFETPVDHGTAWRRMKAATPSQPCSELQLVEALKQADQSRVLCLLSEITHLPFAIVDHVFLGRDHTALLILARASNFAWSTMRLLAGAHQTRLAAEGVSTGADLDLDRLAMEFEDFPRPVAERAMRFIRTYALAKQSAN